MIISEKQIMQLISIARVTLTLIEDKNKNWQDWGIKIAEMLDQIDNQQSSELKVIE